MDNHPRWEKSRNISSDWNYVVRSSAQPSWDSFLGYARELEKSFYAYHKRSFLEFDRHGPFDTLEEAQRLVEVLARMEPPRKG